MIKKTMLAVLCASAMGAVSAPVFAEVIVIRQHPPELRAERVPAPRAGHVWAQGYWDWRRGRHVWVRGHWVQERPGYVYNQPSWHERDGRWEMRRGEWVRARRDSDGDGVPNRYDIDRDGDGIRNGQDRDKDGDGVRNRDDARPNNPNRY